jgi:hypothetical protein
VGLPAAGLSRGGHGNDEEQAAVGAGHLLAGCGVLQAGLAAEATEGDHGQRSRGVGSDWTARCSPRQAGFRKYLMCLAEAARGAALAAGQRDHPGILPPVVDAAMGQQVETSPQHATLGRVLHGPDYGRRGQGAQARQPRPGPPFAPPGMANPFAPPRGEDPCSPVA